MTMPRTCTICAHKDREGIDRALAVGTSLRNIAKRFATSATALHRHKAHVKAVLAKAQETREVALGDSLADQLRSIHAKTLALLNRAETAGDQRTMLGAIKEARASEASPALDGCRRGNRGDGRSRGPSQRPRRSDGPPSFRAAGIGVSADELLRPPRKRSPTS